MINKHLKNFGNIYDKNDDKMYKLLHCNFFKFGSFGVNIIGINKDF